MEEVENHKIGIDFLIFAIQAYHYFLWNMLRTSVKHWLLFIVLFSAGFFCRAQEVKFVLKPENFNPTKLFLPDGSQEISLLQGREEELILMNVSHMTSDASISVLKVNREDSADKIRFNLRKRISISNFIPKTRKDDLKYSLTAEESKLDEHYYLTQMANNGRLLASSDDGQFISLLLASEGSIKLLICDLKSESILFSKDYYSEKDLEYYDIDWGYFSKDKFFFQLTYLAAINKDVRKWCEFDFRTETYSEADAYGAPEKKIFIYFKKYFSADFFNKQLEVPAIQTSIQRTESGLLFKSLAGRFSDFFIQADSLLFFDAGIPIQKITRIELRKNGKTIRYLYFDVSNGRMLNLTQRIGFDYAIFSNQNVWNIRTDYSKAKKEKVLLQYKTIQSKNESGNLDSLKFISQSTFRPDSAMISLYARKKSSSGFYAVCQEKILQLDFGKRIFNSLNISSSLNDEFLYPIRNPQNYLFEADTTCYSSKSMRRRGYARYVKWKINGNKLGYGYPPRDYGLKYSSLNDLFQVDAFRDGSRFFYAILASGVASYDSKINSKTSWATSLSPKVRTIKLSYGQEFVAVWQADGVMSFLNAANGNKFLSAFVDTSSMNWVMWTPSGYYDCSPQGEKLIGWSVSRGNDSLPLTYPAAMFRNRFFRPDLIDSALKYHSEEIALKSLRLEGGTSAYRIIAECQPPVVYLTRPDNNSFFSDSSLSITYALKPGSSPVQQIKVYVNGRPVKTLVPERGSNSLEVKVPDQNCTVGISAVSACGESELAFSSLYWKGEKRSQIGVQKADLYILAIGVTRYRDSYLSLKLPAKDARDFCNFFKNQEKGLYKNVHVRLLTDSLATREAIQQGLEWLEKNAGPRDVSMIFLAGHGENDRNNMFYFLPWEANPESMKSTSVPYYDFKNTVAALPGKVIFFADACRSGNIFGDMVKRSVNIDVLARELASGNGGSVVFTSSGRKQASLENEAWGNGAFTKALLEGLEGKADIFNEGFISIKGLDLFISRRVREITENRQIPNTIIPESIPDFVIAVKKQN